MPKCIVVFGAVLILIVVLKLKCASEMEYMYNQEEFYKNCVFFGDVALQGVQRISGLLDDVQINGTVLMTTALDGLQIYALTPLQDNLIQVGCFIVLLYLMVVLQKENLEYRKLVKDLKIAEGTMRHAAWQVDVAEQEMEALTSRLSKNEITRIPEITKKLEHIYKILDMKQENLDILNKELNFLQPSVQTQSEKLRKLNNMLRMDVDCEKVREIRTTGVIAAYKMNEMSDKLHDRIQEAKAVLDLTNTLMDIKGIPLRVEW